MSTLSTVRNHIKSDLFIEDSTVYDAQIDNAIRSALRQCSSKRFWFLWVTGSVTLESGNTTVTLPSNFGVVDAVNIIYSGNRLRDGNGFDLLHYDRLRSEYLDKQTLSSGRPKACAVMNNLLYVSHTADADYTIVLDYYRKDATLPSGDSATSVWFDDGYDVIRSLAMWIFKREAQGYTATDEDGANAAYYMKQLSERHLSMNWGR